MPRVLRASLALTERPGLHTYQSYTVACLLMALTCWPFLSVDRTCTDPHMTSTSHQAPPNHQPPVSANHLANLQIPPTYLPTTPVHLPTSPPTYVCTSTYPSLHCSLVEKGLRTYPLPVEDHGAPRPPQRLVGGGGHDVGIVEGRRDHLQTQTQHTITSTGVSERAS